MDFETSQKADLAFTRKSTLRVGDAAPDFKITLFGKNGAGTTGSLLSTNRKKPLVLFFGSATCNLTIRNAPEMRKLHATYGSKADFAFVYMKDAHPSSKSVQVGKIRVRLEQPRTMKHRCQLAQYLVKKTQFQMPVYMDDMHGSARKAYHSYHLAAYIIDVDQKLAFIRTYKYTASDLEANLKAILKNGGRLTGSNG